MGGGQRAWKLYRKLCKVQVGTLGMMCLIPSHPIPSRQPPARSWGDFYVRPEVGRCAIFFIHLSIPSMTYPIPWERLRVGTGFGVCMGKVSRETLNTTCTRYCKGTEEECLELRSWRTCITTVQLVHSLEYSLPPNLHVRISLKSSALSFFFHFFFFAMSTCARTHSALLYLRVMGGDQIAFVSIILLPTLP
jgi:hypothetical protein